MELRSGYKQTEVGVIPEEWGVTDVKDITRRHKQGFYTKDRYIRDGVRLVRITDLMNPVVDYSAMPMLRISREDFESYKIRKGDFLFARSGAIGRYGIVYEDVEAIFGSYIIRFAFDTSKVVPEYFGLMYETHVVWRQLSSITQGSSNININASNIKAIRIPLPLLPEQRAIAAALSDVDALLAKLDALIAKKRNLKQAAMQQLLTGQTRLPGFSGEWEVVEAGDIGRFRGGSGFPTKYQGATSGDYPFFKVSDMNNEGNETFMQVANNYVSGAMRKQLGATAFPAKSIVFAKVGAAVFLERKRILAQASCLDNNMAAFILDSDRADCRFVHYVLLNTKLGDLVSTTALPSLNGSVLSAVTLAIPPLNEQSAIATVLSDMDAEIVALEARREKTRALKQGMMQELLTGRIRLV